MKKWVQAFLYIFTLFVVAGCSSIADDDRQVMTVKTLPSWAQCTLQNEDGEFVVGSSSETLTIETACEEITIICKKDGYKDTSSSVKHSFKGIVWGNVSFWRGHRLCS